MMLRWLQFRFGRLPLRVHRIAFYPAGDEWHDVVIDFEKDSPDPVGVDFVQFRGWVRWLSLVDQPSQFTLLANRRIQIRFGAMSSTDFEAFLALLRDKGGIKARLALRSGTTKAVRTCLVSRESIEHNIQTPWPPRAAVA